MASWTTYVFTSMALRTVLSSRPQLLTLSLKRFIPLQTATGTLALLSFMEFFCAAGLRSTPYCR